MDKWDVMDCWDQVMGLRGRGMKSVWKVREGFDNALEAVGQGVLKAGKVEVKVGLGVEVGSLFFASR